MQGVEPPLLIILQIPYRSRFGSASKSFTDLTSYRANNCVAKNGTNGEDLYSNAFNANTYSPAEFFQQQAPLSPEDRQQHAVNVIMDGTPLADIDLPEVLQPSIPSLNESYSVAQFYLLKDNVTGVLVLGSFSAENFTALGIQLLAGLRGLKASGAKQLIVDVVC